MHTSMLAGMISLTTKADSGIGSALIWFRGIAATARSSSLYKLLLFISLGLLACVVDGAGLADDSDLYLTGIGHLVLDLLCNLG